MLAVGLSIQFAIVRYAGIGIWRVRMYKESDELIALYDNPEWISYKNNRTISVLQDWLFGGDMEKWRAYAKALKARLLLRMIPNWKTSENGRGQWMLRMQH